MSNTKESPSLAGAEKLIGLVPRTAFLDLVGALSGEVLVMLIPYNSSSESITKREKRSGKNRKSGA